MWWKIIIYWVVAIVINLAIVFGIAFGAENKELASDVSFGIFGIALFYQLILYFVFVRNKTWWIVETEIKPNFKEEKKFSNPLSSDNGILMFYGNMALILISVVMALVIV